MAESTPIGDEPVLGSLRDAWQRLEWANSDGEAFARVGKGLVETGAYAVWVEHDGDRWQATFRRLCDPAIEEEALDELARRLGAFLEHNRAALNYCAYQFALLALRKNPALDSPDLLAKDRLRADKIECPLVRNREQFRGHNGIRNLPDEHRDVLDAIQPYDGRNEGLWLLQELAREYRHRVVHPAAITPVEDMHHVLVNGVRMDTHDMEIVPHERLEDGDVVLRFSLPGIDPDADVKPQIVLTIGIDHVLARGLKGTSVLNQITADIGPAIEIIERGLARAYAEIAPIGE
ncbi:MAG TPA: hypothetical protein VN892_00095 [Solirubrobacteraceae bacterium]|nr:hypothetical protein [Solirubrobacteraceae bacterium]